MKNTELITSGSVARQMTENKDEYDDIEEEIYFDTLNIPGNYSGCDIFEKEKQTMSKSDEVYIKNNNDIWRETVGLGPYYKKRG